MWDAPAGLKEAYNHPLSTGGCNCQASEEERLNELQILSRLAEVSNGTNTVTTLPYMKLT